MSFLSLPRSMLMNYTFPGSKAFQVGLQVDNMRDRLPTTCRAETGHSGRRPQPRLQEPPQGEIQTLLQVAGAQQLVEKLLRYCASGTCQNSAGEASRLENHCRFLQGGSGWFPTLNSASILSGGTAQMDLHGAVAGWKAAGADRGRRGLGTPGHGARLQITAGAGANAWGTQGRHTARAPTHAVPCRAGRSQTEGSFLPTRRRIAEGSPDPTPGCECVWPRLV